MVRGRIHLTISPQSSRDYIAVEGGVDILPRVAAEGKRRCYNIASGLNITLGDIVGIIERELSAVGEWRSGAPTAIYPVINIERIQSEFCFTPRSALDALASACQEFHAHARLP